jgi:hypothetical protein
MKSNDYHKELYSHLNARCVELLQRRNTWTEEESAEMQTVFAVLLKIFKAASPSKIREAAMGVEIKHHMKFINE